MELIALLFWFMFLVDANVVIAEESSTHTSPGTTETNTTNTIDVVQFLVDTNVIIATESSTPASATITETNTINTIDVLQNQLNQILVQFCASEIDRNKTASAILKFGKLANAKSSIKDVVQFYIENYEESFDNLLLFINHISSFELQKLAYNTLVEAINSNQINVINLLSFENFLRMKFELLNDDIVETMIYKELLSTLGDHIKKLIVATDLNKVLAFINNTNNPDRIFELIPTIVQGIDLTNFTDMDRIFKFSMQLPIANQIKLISKVLSEMQEKRQFQHVFHIICQLRLLRSSVSQKDLCSLSALEREIPLQVKQMVSDDTLWQIKSDYEFLYFESSSKYSKTMLFLRSEKLYYGWVFKSKSFNSVSIMDRNNGYYLSVEYCFHNDSFPTVRGHDSDDLTQNHWYFLMSDDLTHFQIKNTYTNDLLIVEDISEIRNDKVRVALSSKCSDCDSSKWLLEAESINYPNIYSNCRNSYLTED